MRSILFLALYREMIDNEIIVVCILKFKMALQSYQLNVCNICDDMP